MARSRRPVIVVAGPDRAGLAAWVMTWLAVRRAGGRARRVSSSRRGRGEAFDGLILGGGADVDPAWYAEDEEKAAGGTAPPRPTARSLPERALSALLSLLRHLLSASDRGKRFPGIDRRRDKLEFALLERALRDGLPVLGICRGAQLLNVHFGGSLHRNVTGFYIETPPIRSLLPRKTIRVRPASRLARVFRTARGGAHRADCYRVNALHRQAIDQPGRGLVVTAREPNGLPQAVEAARERFIVGVQWHPEYMPHRPEQQAIFTALVRDARAAARRFD